MNTITPDQLDALREMTTIWALSIAAFPPLLTILVALLCVLVFVKIATAGSPAVIIRERKKA